MNSAHRFSQPIFSYPGSRPLVLQTNITPSSQSSIPSSRDILRQELPNGIIALARANFSSPSVVIKGYLEVGALFDPEDRLGLADFTAAALMRGTTYRDFLSIYDALESAAASLGFEGGTHTTHFGGKSLAEDLDLVLELLGECLRYPTFPSEQIERLRAQLLTALAIRQQDTAEMASLTFDKIVYDGHPYSRPEEGYPETIQAIRREDVEQFHKMYYGPRRMVIVVVGAVEPQVAVERIAYYLGDWQNPHQPQLPALPPVKPLETSIMEKVNIPAKSQADLIMGVAGPERRSPHFLAAALGNSVLGQFGMMGRIGEVVRKQAGLAYYAYSSLEGGLGPGPWYVAAGVDPANIERAIELIRAEIERFISEAVSEEELSDSQASFIGRLPLSLETNTGVASAILNLERFDLGLDYYLQYPDLVRAVTRQEVLETARRYLHPDRLGIAIAGP